jgi:uncharacterized membrane protein YbhN (UPF0104 family)
LLTWHLLLQANKWLLTGAVFFFILSKIIAAFRLNIYFRNSNIQLSEASNLRLYWLGMFYNLFLPGGIGGDAYKVIFLKKQQRGETKILTAAVLLDRVSGIIGLVLLAAVISLSLNNTGNDTIVLFLGGLACLAAYYFTLNNILKPLSGLSCFINTLLLGVLVQLLQVVCVFLLVKSINIIQHQPAYILIFLLSSIAAVLPISVGGLGIREMVFLLGSNVFFLDKQQSIYISILFYIITVIVSFTGILWMYKDPVKE